MGRDAIAILSSKNLIHNIKQIKSIAKNSQIMAVVKANAFGHGLRSVSKYIENYTDKLGVASIDEALALRNAGIKKTIVLLEGVFEKDEFLICACQNFEVVLHNARQIEWLKDMFLPNALKVWIKLDSGMGRLGFFTHELEAIKNELLNNEFINKDIGLFSHFACADNLDSEHNNKQIKNFEIIAKNWPGSKTFLNSAGIFNFPNLHFDMVRTGIAMYGISPFKNKSAIELNLKPVMRLQTRIISIKNYKKGDSIGYNANYICNSDQTIGIIAIGYGDGYLKQLSHNTPVLIRGKKCLIVGDISMDMTAVDLTNCPLAQIGDDVLLWGDELPIESILKKDMIAYELLTAIQMRVKFNWSI